VKTFIFWLIAAAFVALAGGFYMTQMPGASFRGGLPALNEDQQSLSEMLSRHVDALASEAGTRGAHQPAALTDACEYLKSQLRRAGYEVQNEQVDEHGLSLTSLQVTLVGQSRPQDVIVIAAHYDSVPGSPGADANASGCAVLLEIARAMIGKPTDRTVRFVLFPNGAGAYAENEKSGAAHFARDARKRGDKIVAMVSLDTLGTYRDGPGSQSMPFPMSLVYPDTGNFVLFAGDLSSRDLVRACVAEFRKSARFPGEGLSEPGFLSCIAPSDDVGFRSQDVPAIVVTDTGKLRNDKVGGALDTADKLDYTRMARVTEGLVHVVQSLAQRSVTL
jgi:Zn-dependent M28 family amino/carboxypeptidase